MKLDYVVYPPPKAGLPFIAVRIVANQITSLYQTKTLGDAEEALKRLEQDHLNPIPRYPLP